MGDFGSFGSVFDLAKTWLQRKAGCDFIELKKIKLSDFEKRRIFLLDEAHKRFNNSVHQSFQLRSVRALIDHEYEFLTGYSVSDNRFYVVGVFDSSSTNREVSQQELFEFLFICHFYCFIMKSSNRLGLINDVYVFAPNLQNFKFDTNKQNQLFDIESNLESSLKIEVGLNIFSNEHFYQNVFLELKRLIKPDEFESFNALGEQLEGAGGKRLRSVVFEKKVDHNNPEYYFGSSKYFAIQKVELRLKNWFPDEEYESSQVKKTIQKSHTRQLDALITFLKLKDVRLSVTTQDLIAEPNASYSLSTIERMASFNHEDFGKFFNIEGGVVTLYEDVESDVVERYNRLKAALVQQPTLETKLWALIKDQNDYENNKDLIEQIKARLYKYRDDGWLEERSLTIKDQLLMQFLKLAQAINFKDINTELSELRAVNFRGETSNGQLSLRTTSCMKDVLVKVEYFSENYKYFVSKGAFSVHVNRGVYASDALGETVRFNRWLRDLIQVVEETPVPTYEELWITKDLLDFTSDCFSRAVEMAGIANIFLNSGVDRYAWAALAKSKEFLGIFYGARVALNPEFKTRIGSASRKWEEDEINFLFESKLKALFLEQKKQQKKPFNVPRSEEGKMIKEKDRQDMFYDDLLENHLIDIYINIKSIFGRDLQDNRKHGHKLSDRDLAKEKLTAKFELLDGENQTSLGKAFNDLKSEVLTMSPGKEIVEEMITEQRDNRHYRKQSKKPKLVCIPESEIRKLIYSIDAHYDAQHARNEEVSELVNQRYEDDRPLYMRTYEEGSLLKMLSGLIKKRKD